MGKSATVSLTTDTDIDDFFTKIDALVEAAQASNTRIAETNAKLDAILAKIGTVGTGAPSEGSGTTVPPAPVDYFPADPFDAPFPSPDRSITAVSEGRIVGKPYVRSQNGAVYRFVTDADGKPVPVTNNYGTGYKWLINGQASIATHPATEILVAGQYVFTNCPGSAWTRWPNDVMAGALTKQTLPAPLPPPGSLPPPPPQMPPEPALFSPAPGSTGKIIEAGPSKPIKTLAAALAAAANGDTITLEPGVYTESLVISKAVLIDGGGRATNAGRPDATYTPGAVIDYFQVDKLAQGKGGLVPTVDCVIRGLEIRGAGVLQTEGQLTSAIRNAGPGRFTVDHCHLHHNQVGIGSGGFPANWYIRDTILRDCGIGDGRTHNVYLGGDTVRNEYENVTSVCPVKYADPRFASGAVGGGHAIKTRAHAITVRNCHLMATDGSMLDMPNGTNEPFMVENTTLEKPADAPNHRLLSYAVENQANGTTGGTIKDSTLIGACPRPFIQTLGGKITLENCQKVGAITKTGDGEVVGL